MHSFILFLDFDGVLHPGTSGTARYAPALEAVMLPFPQAQVVVSSNWRMGQTLEELRGWFSDAFAPRLIDVTPVLPNGERASGRQGEIEQWLRANPTLLWRALDGEASLFQEGCPWLIPTDRRTGLDEQALGSLRTTLSRAFNA